jgi:hypothetical protein
MIVKFSVFDKLLIEKKLQNDHFYKKIVDNDLSGCSRIVGAPSPKS